MRMDTGEICNYREGANRGDNIQAVRRSIAAIRDLINANFEGGPNELMFTLTYAANMTDGRVLYSDFQKFWQRFKYRFGSAEYLAIAEPQGRGAWHMHVLIRRPSYTYVHSGELRDIWGHGHVKVKRLKSADNLGGYFAAYLGDIEVRSRSDILRYKLGTGQAANVVRKEVNGKSKAFIKGGRLLLYPLGMRLYRCSRGIKAAEYEEVDYGEIKGVVGEASPNYSQTVDIRDTTGKLVNSVTYEEYNLKRLITLANREASTNEQKHYSKSRGCS